MPRKRFLAGKRGLTKLTIYASVAVILLLLPVMGLSTYYIHILIGIFIYTIAAVSLRLVNISGQGSLGHAGFMGVGAYTSAMLARYLGWTPWLTIIIGALVSLGIGFLVSIPFCRLRGIYFTMISLFFGMAVLATIAVFQNYTGGEAGFPNVPPLFGLSKIPYYYFYLFLLIICLLIMYRLEFSRIGLTWKAIAQSHPVASSIGINETGQRRFCWAIGGFFGGLAGAMFVHYYQIASVSSFAFFTSIYLFIYMMVGGVNAFSGPIIGAFILILVPAVFRNLKEYVPFLFAIILIIVIYLMPEGIAGLPDQIRLWIDNSRKKKRILPNNR